MWKNEDFKPYPQEVWDKRTEVEVLEKTVSVTVSGQVGWGVGPLREISPVISPVSCFNCLNLPRSIYWYTTDINLCIIWTCRLATMTRTTILTPYHFIKVTVLVGCRCSVDLPGNLQGGSRDFVSTLDQVMACCLTAPSHSLQRCCLTMISKTQRNTAQFPLCTNLNVFEKLWCHYKQAAISGGGGGVCQL